MKRGLFLKYVVLFVGLVTGVLVINAALDMYFVYQDNRRASIEVQREKAESAAQKIESFVREIERQLGWVTQAQWASLPDEQRRFDYVRLLRQVLPITELVQLDRKGHEQLRVSRLSMDVVGAGTDRSQEPAYKEAMASGVYFSPVYFRKESEPYLTMAVRHGGKSGVTIADINLKLILDVISQIKIGKNGYAFVVDRQGRLVAHPDISLVLRGTDMSRLAQVAAALSPTGDSDTPVDATNRAGVPVLSAHATIPALNWIVFVELPTSEAQQPVVNAGLRALALLVLGLIIAGLAGALLARRMVVPIRALQAGAQRIGSGELGHRLSIKTGDELEALANQFNHSAEALEESYATLEQRVEDRTRELSESLEQQTATAEILRVISQSPTDVAPVMQAVAKAAVRFCGAEDAHVFLRDGDEMVSSAHEGPLSAHPLGYRDALDAKSTARAQSILEARVTHIADTLSPEAEAAYALIRENSIQHDFRAQLNAPMLREGRAIGCICLRRREPGAFTARQIELLETFAAQAVIAIQNVHLFTELRESLEQQTATAEILRVISQSPDDVEPVLKVVATAALRFCGARDVLIALREGDELVNVAHEGAVFAEQGRRRPIERSAISGRAAADGKTVHVPDALELDATEFAGSRKLAAERGWRAAVAAPMMREGTAIGTILLRRPDAGPFAPRQIELLEAFAAQAVIAIENVRLFTDELRESLEQQTATGDILRVISQSPTDVQPVLDAVVRAALRFCGARDALIALREGEDNVITRAHAGALGSTTLGLRRDLARHTALGRSIRDARTVHLSDINQLDSDEAKELWASHNVQAAMAAPMLREGVPIGAILLRKPEPGPFTPRQIELLEAFAAQAVIAIENVRLFTELDARNSELRESLEYQTAITDVLKVMSHSTFDLEPVLQTVLVTAVRLCRAQMASIFQLENGAYRWKVGYGLDPRYQQTEADTPILPGPGTLVGRVALSGATVRVTDAQVDSDYAPKDDARLQNVRSMLGVPMMRDGKPFGVIALARDRVESFTDKQVEVVEVFADQAVIAIENVRLINEIRDKSHQLEVASQHKSQFLANMSHELRTPLNAIIGYTEMMADGLYGDVPEKAAGVLERVQSNGRHLLGLINDVLDLSKIEAGQLSLAIEDYSVGDMVNTVMAATESLARAKGLALESAVAPGLPMGRGDARRLSQVLLNLVGNAIKFTDQGTVEISGKRNGEFFELAVNDTGFGIAPEDQKRIFDEFQQVDNTSTRKKGGTGLGLSISRKIVELHGGSITVTSEIGKGSTFKVTVPINAIPVREAAQ